MMLLIPVWGIILGTILFLFVFILCKKAKQYHLASLITFLFSILVIAYGYIIVRGFEGFGYLLLGVGILFPGIVGTIWIPKRAKKHTNQSSFNQRDKILLFTLPVLFLGTISLMLLWG
ncbi:hypothetical protein EDD68_11048 [Melghiribacillus thermohalophilus]|uniref:YesK-like protein n=1 Tax=Melghiribacillus thermohalophilus TaxID=1324956 RepID=A0A4R3MZ94_9BACI|nr:YesK family protein [Melghiribacillus thermohalophilus]TCT21744.1 hypothetical protein EDD68_11048 [Melghiribacillus thermohalophilus]